MSFVRDTIRSLEGKLDDVRCEYAWRAIVRTIDQPDAREQRARRRLRWWMWLIVPGTALAAAAATLPSATIAHSARVEVIDVPPVDVAQTEPVSGPVEHAIVVDSSRGPALQRVVPRAPSAAELYQRAETALAAHDPQAARRALERLVLEHPRDARVDAARYDLALIAHGQGDDVRALALLDAILASGRDPSVRTAATALRDRLAP